MAETLDKVLRGTVVTPDSIIPNGWVGLRGEHIAAIGTGAHPTAATVTDYGAALLLPGVIDGQVHCCSYRGLAGIESTTRSAIAGGVTTVVDMPYDDPEPLTSLPLLDRKIAAIDRWAHSDVALYATLGAGQDAADIAALAAAGICAIKISSFENHPTRFPRIETDQMLAILEQSAKTGIAIGLHNEDQPIVRAAMARLKASGQTDISAHSPSRPAAAELAATVQFLELAAASGGHAHIVHLSVPRGFDLVARYHAEGTQATAEMCIHYLLLDAAKDGPTLGGLMKVNPPIRDGVREALWQALDDGKVAFVSSDHSGWPLSRKTAASIFDVSAGVPGLETLLAGFFTALAARGQQAATLCARYLSENPARFFGLWPRKGAIAIGADADIVVLTEGAFPYDAAAAQDELNWSPFQGQPFAVRPVATYLRGALAWADGTVLNQPGAGAFCRRMGAA